MEIVCLVMFVAAALCAAGMSWQNHSLHTVIAKAKAETEAVKAEARKAQESLTDRAFSLDVECEGLAVENRLLREFHYLCTDCRRDRAEAPQTQAKREPRQERSLRFHRVVNND